MTGRLIVTAATGTESLLVHELRSLGLDCRAGRAGTVELDGNRLDGARAAVHSRVAVRVLEEVGVFVLDGDGKRALYEGTRAIDWTEHATARTTIAVKVKSASQNEGPFASSIFAAQVIKDAIVDRIRDASGGERPSVDRRDPDVLVIAHIGRGRAELFLDLAGGPLHRRGYRVAPTAAPLKESLAAAVVLAARYDGTRSFLDPMTGSGTLAIEAARIARRIAPRAGRLGMERWASFDDGARVALERIRGEARAAELPRVPAPLVAIDSDPAALEAARANAARARVDRDIVFQRGDARAVDVGGAGTLIAVNPPYGDRLAARDLDSLYEDFARCVRARAGVSLVALSGNPRFERAIGPRPRWSREVRNGPIRCRLLYWDL
ncbi:MAG: RNA methyltransferase [Deltaproteobacteria bacterium]|nr:RNA methyltransferase [Deltaproteobacteria bacterium]